MKQLYCLVMLLIPGALFLTSCANHIYLDDPVLTSPLRDTSMSELVSVSIHDVRKRHIRLKITMFDEKKIKDYEIAQDIYQVPTGIRRVRIEYSRNFGDSGRHAEVEHEVHLEPGRRYHPIAERICGNKVKIWIADARTGERVSDIITEKTYPQFDTSVQDYSELLKWRPEGRSGV